MPKRKTSKGGPFTQAEFETLRKLHAEGLSRNAIGREMERSTHTVSLYAEQMGLSFVRTRTAAATEARRLDFKARRQAIIEQLYDVAEDDLGYLKGREPYELIEVSSGTAVPFSPKRLPAQDRRALVQSASAALNSAARLEAVDTNNGVDDATSMLGQLATGLTAAYNAMNEGAGDAP